MNVPVSRPDTFSYMSKIFHTIIIMLLRVVSVYVLWMTSRVKRRKFKKLCKSKLRSLNQNYGASVDSYKFKPDLFPYKCEMLICPFYKSLLLPPPAHKNLEKLHCNIFTF